MSNNLRQIAKDLRSFVKRCKDVHYSDSLLITFLVTGLLTLAPKTLSADVVEEQQEISASAYDTITDLRQSFIRARQENEKSIKGAERELILLMEQGDQVIKSPWASFQFATGFTNNDWRTSYRGRGGKYLEYYRRNNDLTKYVFDADKNSYGATRLNLPRNQEPNSLTINPANRYEPYEPYRPVTLDSITPYDNLTFNPELRRLNGINGVTVTNTTLSQRTVTHGTTGFTNRKDAVRNENITENSINYGKFISDSTATGTITGGVTSLTPLAGGSFELAGGTTNERYYNAWRNASDQRIQANLQGIEGTFDNGTTTYTGTYNMEGYTRYVPTPPHGGYWDPTNGTFTDPTTRSVTNKTSGTIYDSVASFSPGSHTTNWGNPTAGVRGASIIVTSGTSNSIGTSTFNIGDLGGSSKRIGIHVSAGNVNISKGTSFNTYGDGTGIYTASGTITDLGITGGAGRVTFTSYGTGNGVFNKGKMNLENADFNYGTNNTNDINYIYNEGEVNISGSSTFDIYKSSNGVLSKTANGKVYDNGSHYYIYDDNGAGINNESSNASAVTTNNTVFHVSDRNVSLNDESIGIRTNNGTTNTTNSQFIINGGAKNNGISSEGSAKVISTTDSFTVEDGELNSGIRVSSTASSQAAEVKGSSFTIAGTGPTGRIGAKNAGVRNTGSGAIHITSSDNGIGGTRSTFGISGHQNAGFENVAAGTDNVVEYTTFTIGGSHSVADQTNTGISNHAGGTVTVKNNTIFNINDSWNSGIFNNAGGTIDIKRDNNNAPYNKFFVNGDESNGVINYAGGTVNVDRSDFSISGSRSNGVLNTAGGTVNITNSHFTLNDGITRSNGFYDRANGTTDVDSSTFKVYGTENNGIYFKGHSTATTPQVKNSTFYVNQSGALNNSRVKNTGILIGNSAQSINTKSNPTITDSTFHVYGKDTQSTGILLDQGKAEIKGGVMKVYGDTNGITLTRNARALGDGNTITFAANTSGNAMTITTSGGNNRAINIQGGSYGATNDIQLTGKVNIDITDSNTAGYLNQYYANNLVIKNDGGIPNTTSDQGRIYVTGSNNTVFANLGYAKAGSVELSDVLVKAANTTTPVKDNTILYFAGNTANGNKLQTAQKGAIGWFGGAVRVQGVIGSGDPTGTIPFDERNVGIYAVSGQRSNLNSSYIGDPASSPSNISNINVDNFNIGVNGTARNTVLIYAGNGTGLDIKQGTTAIAGGTAVANADIITDGAESNGSNVVYSYKTHDNNTGRWTTIGYAVGEFNDGPLGLINAANSGENGKGSEINFKANVDMTSRQSTAFYAKDGGKITIGEGTAKNTRAGGYESIVAYATGANQAGAGSLVKINGNITAADYNMLGDDNRKTSGSIEQWMAPDSLQANTYKNIAAFAINGGQVTVTGSTAATDAKEPTTATSKSLVYGMGAYAEGKAAKNVSTVDFQSGITVISGTNGALYATKDGSIKFQGNIVNQNNITARDSDKISVNSNGIVNSGDRYGRGPVTGVTNDHTTVTPFYVNWNTSTDKAAIEFANTTKIDMYDGIFFTGNQFFRKTDNVNDYNGHFSDYTSKVSTTDEFKNAKYRGMDKVTVNILKTYDGVNGVNLGLINHKDTDITWDSDRDGTTTTGFLKGIGDYAGGATFKNYAETGSKSSSTNFGFASTLINGNLKVDQDVNLENAYETSGRTTGKNDPFNNITMESELVTINTGKKVTGDVADGYRLGQGLNMANKLYRWNEYTVGATKNYVWEKTANSESGYINKGEIDVSGGTTKNAVNIAGMRVSYGTASNSGTAAKIKVDHGYGIVGTDNTVISNEGKIEVTGKYVGNTSGGVSTKRTNNGFSAETDKPAGENYGIVGVSRYDTVSYEDSYVINNKTIITNAVDITNKGGKIIVEGTRATGIYAANVNADQSNVNISYDNSASSSNQDLIRVNSETTGNADNKGVYGVGIALVNKGATSKTGGTITLNTKGDALSSSVTPDIRTAYNGFGIYGESADIVFASASKGVTIESKDNGAGIWITDDSHISSTTDRSGTPKELNYNYQGTNNKKGFGLIFGSTLASNTVATNYLDINFNNASGTMTLANEKAQSATTPASGSTYKGIAGIMANTDAGDIAKNYGKIEEKVSSTHVRGYGAVVNRGNFEKI